MKNNKNQIIKELDNVKNITQNKQEYWMGRDIQEVLGYTKWENFLKVIDKATISCKKTGKKVSDHFLEAGKMIVVGNGANKKVIDFFLSRYACYLIAMNGDPKKPEIAAAQNYFAIQTRKQELEDSRKINVQKRVLLRNRVKEANKHLNKTAIEAGVLPKSFGVFHDAGYRGLYTLPLSQIKKKKGLAPKDNLLDWMGRTELAANEFRITQTADKLMRENIQTEKGAIDTHNQVGKEVRATIKKVGGTMPEKLPLEENIKKIAKDVKKLTS